MPSPVIVARRAFAATQTEKIISAKPAADRQRSNPPGAAPSTDFYSLLERAGFEIRGTRANCPHCEGSSRSTVAIGPGAVFFCHRCKRGGNDRTLARAQGLRLPPRRVRLADKPKQQFKAWLSKKMSEMAREERRLHRRAKWAAVALSFYPDHEAAWSVLAEWHHREYEFSVFWQSATDATGRCWLYRAWRGAPKKEHAHEAAVSR
jgi:hypothetical protein